MSHTCQALVIHCMDFRFVEGIKNYLNTNGLNRNYDEASIAGGAGALLKDESKDLLLKQVVLSAKLHGISKVILINHQDCGAYGGSDAFVNPTMEQAKHTADLHKAADIVKNANKSLTIDCLYAILDGHDVRLERVS